MRADAGVILGIWLALIATGFASGAAAQPALDETVRLRSGGFVRGVISEYVPGSHVTIMTPDGVLHRFSADEVEAVEPSSESSPVHPPEAEPATGGATTTELSSRITDAGPDTQADAAQPAASASESTADISVFETDQERLILLGRGPRGSRVRLCGLPCRLRVPRGTHVFGAERLGATLWSREVFTTAGPARFRVTWNGRGGARTAGQVVLVVGGILALGLIIAGVGLMSGTRGSAEAGWAALGPGLGSAVLALAVGIPLASSGDELDIDLVL